jgi:hypothetical protein
VLFTLYAKTRFFVYAGFGKGRSLWPLVPCRRSLLRGGRARGISGWGGVEKGDELSGYMAGPSVVCSPLSRFEISRVHFFFVLAFLSFAREATLHIPVHSCSKAG